MVFILGLARVRERRPIEPPLSSSGPGVIRNLWNLGKLALGGSGTGFTAACRPLASLLRIRDGIVFHPVLVGDLLSIPATGLVEDLATRGARVATRIRRIIGLLSAAAAGAARGFRGC